MDFSKIIGIRRARVLLFLLCSSGCGVFHRSPDELPRRLPATATSAGPSTTVEIKRTQGQFMLANSSPVYEHPDKASAVIAYIPQGSHENVTAVTGDWLLIRLPDGKVGFIPTDSTK